MINFLLRIINFVQFLPENDLNQFKFIFQAKVLLRYLFQIYSDQFSIKIDCDYFLVEFYVDQYLPKMTFCNFCRIDAFHLSKNFNFGNRVKKTLHLTKYSKLDEITLTWQFFHIYRSFQF